MPQPRMKPLFISPIVMSCPNPVKWYCSDHFPNKARVSIGVPLISSGVFMSAFRIGGMSKCLTRYLIACGNRILTISSRTLGDRDMSLPSHLRERILMLSSINFWMCLPGLSTCRGVSVLEKRSARLEDGTSSSPLGCIFIAVPLAVFAPEHFGGPMRVQD